MSPENIIVLTRDSDLICYESVLAVAQPDTNKQLMVYQKNDLLQKLDLPTARHLLLAAIVTSNDYIKGNQFYGIKRNAAIIKGIALEMEGELVAIMNQGVEAYLRRVRSQESKTLDDYRAAVSAFANCQEDDITEAPSQPTSHSRLEQIVSKLASFRTENAARNQVKETGPATGTQAAPLNNKPKLR